MEKPIRFQDVNKSLVGGRPIYTLHYSQTRRTTLNSYVASVRAVRVQI